MATIKYIGRTTDFRGRSLWGIVSNLKNFGVGRIVVRSRMERYEEKSYMKILKVEAIAELPPDNPLEFDRKVKVWVEKVFRGKQYPKPFCIHAVSYKEDYRLLSKKEEAEYCKLANREEKILPREMELPPLLKAFVIKETGQTDVKMPVKIRKSPFKNFRLAEEGETPNVELVMGVGTPHPTAKSLYANI